MAEELVLTDPVVIPEQVTNKYRVVSTTFNREQLVPPATVAGLVLIGLRDNNDEPSSYSYTGQQALDYIKFLNTANFTVKSMQRRILEKLSTDGLLPGTVVGTPDP